MDEANVPQWVVQTLRSVMPVLVRYFQIDSLAMGGGTILQSRWNHRISTDIDLFAATQSFNDVIRTSAAQMERDFYEIGEVDSDRSWVDVNTIYCEVDGIELTVMPSEPLVRNASGCVVPTTAVKTETSATILNKKLVGRMIGGGAYEIRDIFDLYTAIDKDPEALRDAIRPIPHRSLDEVSAMLQALPNNWFSDTTKPLLGVEVQPQQDEMIDAIIREFSQVRPERND